MRIGQAVLSQFALAGIVFLATGITGASSAGQGEQTVNALTLGAAFERDLKSGEAHDYQVTLASGQYLRAVVEQAGIDVVVKVFGPQGQQLDETDSPNGAHGPEPVAVVADAPGGYRLRVSALEANCPPGRYKVRVEELRAATPQDQNRIAAQRASVAAARLAAQATTESRQKAIQKYEEALALWAAAGDRAMQAQTLNHIGDIYVSLRQPKALDSYNRALALWRAVGDRRGEGDTLHNLGLVFAGIGLYQKALDHCNQALALRQELGDRAGQAETLDLIGMIYNGLGERQKAFESYRQALSLWQAAGDRGGEALTLHNIGFAHADL
ncbi:MAG TPA: tetratricopeptide repeat protein, partial [Blastocatellia bacterium]|nr:tetratricopeptide repeat protein [Blastocatellia bacterium]